MNTRHVAKTLLFSVAALALSACSDQRQEPAPKTAVPQEVRNADDAKSHFQQMVNWEKRPDTRATLYGKLISINDSIGELGYEVVHNAAEYEWLAVLDTEPGSYFRHPVSYAFLTYDQPRVSIITRNQLPTRNFEKVWANTSELLQDENVFHDQSWLTKDASRTSNEHPIAYPSNWPPRMVQDHCRNEKRAYAVLIHNITDLNTSPETVDNLESMAASLEANGYYVQQFTSSVSEGKLPYLELSAPKGNGLFQLMNFINIHVDFNDCCEELIVYITGETEVLKSGYDEIVTMDLPFHYSGYDQTRKPERRFYSEDLARIFDQVKTCHLNVIIDTNHAYGLGDELVKIPNTESVLTSCQNNEYTYSSAIESVGPLNFEDPYGLADGENGSEFTSSVAKAFREMAAARVENDDPTPAAILMKSAFDSVKEFDLAYLAGKTTPSLRGRTLDSGCSCGIDEQLTQK